MEPFIGEIRLFAGNFAPQDWTFCDGSLLAISQYEALYTLIGITYGGDGQTTFAVPDLRSRVPLHAGSGYPLGQLAGTEGVALTAGEVASHSHVLQGISPANATSPAAAYPAALGGNVPSTLYGTGSAKLTSLSAQSIGPTAGGGQAHPNIQPYLALTFIISLFGIYPSST